MADSDDTAHVGPLSWRDVYKAVGDSETRILGALTEMKTTVTSTTGDHETRIRTVEGRVDFFYNRETGMRLVGNIMRTLFYIVISAVSAAGTMLMLTAARGGS